MSIQLLPLLLNAQRATQRMFTMDDGLYQSTVNGMWMTYDSLFYVWDGSHDNAMTSFDGYHFELVDSCGMHPYQLNRAKNLEHYSYFWDQGVWIYKDEKFNLILSQVNSNDSCIGRWTDDEYIYIAKRDMKVYRYELSKSEWIFDHGIEDFLHAKWETNESFNTLMYTESQCGTRALIFRRDEVTEVELLSRTEVKIVDFINRYGFLNTSSTDLKTIEKKQWKDEYHRNIEFDYRFFSLDSTSINFPMQEGDGSFYLLELDSFGVSNLGPIGGSNITPTKLNKQSYFISSHDGLQKVNPRIQYFSSSNPNMVGGLYSIIESNDKSIYLGGYGTGFSIYNGKSIEKIKGKFSSAFMMPGAINLLDGRAVFFQDNKMVGIYKLENGSIERLNVTKANNGKQTGYIVKELANGSIALGNPKSEVTIIKNLDNLESVTYLTKSDGLKVKNVLCIEEDKQGRLWLGHPSTGIDLYDRVDSRAYNYEIVSDNPNSFGALSMVIDTDDRLWMGSRQGLKVLEHVSHFDPTMQDLYTEAKLITLPNGDFTLPKFVTEVDDYIVAGTEKAVSFINKTSYATDPDNPIIYQLIYGEDIEGNGSQQNSVLFDSQRRLWIGSNEGASMMLWDEYEWDHTTSKIEIKSIEAGTQSIELDNDDTFELPVDNRNFEIKFGLRRNISLLKNVFFDYFLINEDRDTLQEVRFDQKGILDMAYVQPGSYELHIDARKHGQLMDTQKVYIDAPLSLSESPLFWGGLFSLLFGSLGGFLWWRSRQNKLLLEKQLELSKMQTAQQSLSVQAIVSSFNPHFINNSLHWVQSKYRKDQEMATVIGRLSENTRYIFDKTKQGVATHSLRNELEVVDNYVQIQMVRFKDTFEYRSPDQETVDQLGHFPIFLMMLQIHVENAIEHGLRNRKKSSYVSVSISADASNIWIDIEDDGIGRSGAKKVGSKGTESGVMMLRELISIFNSANPSQITMKYTDDIFQEDGVGYGTLMRISIPKEYNFELT